MRILVVDDDGISRKVAAQAAGRMGHEVVTASGGEEAWRLLEAEDFDVLLTDWIMPVVDGLDLCERVRARTGRPFLYVMLVTQRNKTEDVVTGILAGADDFISKPYEAAELKARLHAAERLVGVSRAICPACYEKRVSPLLTNLRTGRRAS